MILSQKNIEEIAVAVIRDFQKSFFGSEADDPARFALPTPIDQFASDYLNLKVSFQKLSSDGSIYGLTAYVDTEYQIEIDGNQRSIFLKTNALAESQFVRVWKYIAVRSTEERCYYTYVNGQKIKHVVKPKLGEHQSNNPKLVYTMDFQVTPHQLRHTYITNLIYASVDPKTVQYLAGHENSKVTMDIYAKVKYNKPAQLHGVINRAIDTSKKD